MPKRYFQKFTSLTLQLLESAILEQSAYGNRPLYRPLYRRTSVFQSRHGLCPLEKAEKPQKPPSTAFRRYWHHFGKLQHVGHMWRAQDIATEIRPRNYISRDLRHSTLYVGTSSLLHFSSPRISLSRFLFPYLIMAAFLLLSSGFFCTGSRPISYRRQFPPSPWVLQDPTTFEAWSGPNIGDPTERRNQ